MKRAWICVISVLMLLATSQSGLGQDTLESKVKQILLREDDPEKLYKPLYEIGNLGDEQETTAILLKLAKYIGIQNLEHRVYRSEKNH